MSAKRHHAEWLSLVEVSGPFLTMPVLEQAFPQGLDAHDPDTFSSLRAAYEEWDDNQTGRRPNPAIHNAWVRFVLKETLGFPDELLAEGQAVPQTLKAAIAEHGETLRPEFALRNPESAASAGRARLLVQSYPFEQDLEKPVAGRHWKASPATRMMELLHSTEVRLGLVTNGERWMLVDAPRGETTGFASWYAGLWLEEKITLQAFRSLLGVRRFFNVAEGETLEALLRESARHQHEVTDQLGLQVRQAVEVLIQALDRADQDHGGQLLANVPETVLYRAALTIMMRLVFLYCAEERGLLLLGDPLFDQHYAVSTLVAQLQEAADQHGEEVLERRLDAWVRLLSTFRAVHGGIKHERLKLPAYGGGLFDPDRFPFLEGRKGESSWRETPASPLPVNNRTVLHLLRSLQYLEMQGEARRLSFRALDIEQIGHVYEGLLDHTARRAGEAVLGLAGAKGREPEVALKELESHRAGGAAELIEFLRDKTGRSESALRNALERGVEGDAASRLRAACGNEDALFQRVLPFAGLVRDDTFGKPVVIRKGSVYVTEGTDRRSSGTHYTPTSLTEPIVRHTLEPLIYVGPAEGKPREEWTLRTAKELLDLKICDMACGSAAFLVQTCRYLAERLMEAWEEAEQRAGTRQQPLEFGARKDENATPGHRPRITPFGDAASGRLHERLLPIDADERMIFARRLIAQRCLYGVDKNPMAVEMAKLSLWLLTMARDLPFEFLDHAIRSGDSLVGIHDLKQLEYFNLEGDPNQSQILLEAIGNYIREATALRQQIAEMPVGSIEDVERQEALLRQVQEKSDRLKTAADLLVGAEFLPWEQHELVREELDEEDEDKPRPAPDWLRAKRGTEAFRKAARMKAAIEVAVHFKDSDLETFRGVVSGWLNGQVPFHWALEYLEVFVGRGGFDAIVGNPPFMGGSKITGNLGTAYRDHLVEYLAGGKRGSADLCAYFFLRAKELLREDGQFGFLATNTIAQGDTRDVGLEQLTANGCVIPRAVPSRPWPGTANLEVAHVWVRRGAWSGPFVLEDKTTNGITAFLTSRGTVTGNPFRLKATYGKSFNGAKVYGQGFVLDPEEAERLIEKDARNREVLYPYLNGEDLNSRPDQSPSRWVINFFDWPIENARLFADCFRILEEKVKPERLLLKDNNDGKRRKGLWWQYGRIPSGLNAAIAGMGRVLVTAEVSKHINFAFRPPNEVFSHMLIVFPLSLYKEFALVQSSLHEVWCRDKGSTLETRFRYTPSDCFETFPFPGQLTSLDTIGKRYYEHRRQIMLARQEGLTKTYNRFHNRGEESGDIHQLRQLHVEMDQAVAAAYGWTDLDLGHGFHETKQGVRYTISEAARREVLARLLRLNHERYAEEVKQGLHQKKKGRGKKKARPDESGGLFG